MVKARKNKRQLWKEYFLKIRKIWENRSVELMCHRDCADLAHYSDI